MFDGRWRSDFYGPDEEQDVSVGATGGLKAVKVTGVKVDSARMNGLILGYHTQGGPDLGPHVPKGVLAFPPPVGVCLHFSPPLLEPEKRRAACACPGTNADTPPVLCGA